MNIDLSGNGGSTPQEYGATGDGIANDTEAFALCISAAKESGKPVHIPSGTYLVTTIAMLEGIEVFADIGAKFVAASNDAPMLIPASNSKWDGGSFEVGADYNVGVISVTNTTLQNADIKTKVVGAWSSTKNKYSHAAIMLVGSPNNYIVFNKFEVEARNFTYGLYASDGEEGDNTFVNTSNFDLMLWNCSKLIYLYRVGCMHIKFQGEAGFKTDDDCYGIYVDGLSRWNVIDGFISDVGITASGRPLTNKYAYFGYQTSDNVLTVAPRNAINVLAMMELIQDDGVNRIGGIPYFPGAFFPPNSSNNSGHNTDLIGDQDNYLAYAHKRNDLSVEYAHNGITVVDNGALLIPNGMFIPGKMTALYSASGAWDGTQSEKITITFASATWLSSFGFTTNANANFDAVVKFYENGNLLATRTITKNMTESTSSFVHISLLEGIYKLVSQRTTKIEVMFTNITANIFIGSMYAGVKLACGNTFLTKGGGDMYGDVSFDEGTGVVLRSPNGTKYRISVNDDGALSGVKTE